jgi:hypothetical protein
MDRARSIEEMKNPYTFLTGKPEEKIPLGRRRHRQAVNIKMGVRMWTQDRVRWRTFCEYDIRTFLTRRATIGFSRRALLKEIIWLYIFGSTRNI